jgi:hypothetical protein
MPSNTKYPLVDEVSGIEPVVKASLNPFWRSFCVGPIAKIGSRPAVVVQTAIGDNVKTNATK